MWKRTRYSRNVEPTEPSDDGEITGSSEDGGILHYHPCRGIGCVSENIPSKKRVKSVSSQTPYTGIFNVPQTNRAGAGPIKSKSENPDFSIEPTNAEPDGFRPHIEQNRKQEPTEDTTEEPMDASVEDATAPSGAGSQLPEKCVAPLRNRVERIATHSPCVHSAGLRVPLSSVKIHICGLSPAVKRDDIAEIFGHFGPLKKVEFPTNQHPNNPMGRGYAFVHYVCPIDCALAIRHMNQGTIAGQKIAVTSFQLGHNERSRTSRLLQGQRKRSSSPYHEQSQTERSRSPRRCRRSESRSPMRSPHISPSCRTGPRTPPNPVYESPMHRRDPRLRTNPSLDAHRPPSSNIRDPRLQVSKYYARAVEGKSRDPRSHQIHTRGPCSPHWPVRGPGTPPSPDRQRRVTHKPVPDTIRACTEVPRAPIAPPLVPMNTFGQSHGRIRNPSPPSNFDRNRSQSPSLVTAARRTESEAASRATGPYQKKRHQGHQNHLH